MVITIVAAVRTFHSETKQDHATLAVASVRVPATQITNMEDGISEMPLPATKVFDHLPA